MPVPALEIAAIKNNYPKKPIVYRNAVPHAPPPPARAHANNLAPAQAAKQEECCTIEQQCICASCATCAIAAIVCCSMSAYSTNRRHEQCKIESDNLTHQWQPDLNMLHHYDYSELFQKIHTTSGREYAERKCAFSLTRLLDYDALSKTLTSHTGPQTETMEEQNVQCPLLDQLEQQNKAINDNAFRLMNNIGIFNAHHISSINDYNIRTIRKLRAHFNCSNMEERDVQCLALKQMEEKEKADYAAPQTLLAQRIHHANSVTIKARRAQLYCPDTDKVNQEDKKTK